MAVIPTFGAPGLTLIHMDLCEINAGKVPGTGMLVQPVDYPVPQTTKAVHLGVICAELSFGSCTHPAPSPFGKIMYNLTGQDEKKGFVLENVVLPSGETIFAFRFKLEAILQGPTPTAPWCGHFVLQVLCFG